jgi:peptidoglycan/LPS O-acetylase OafA/YrhL
MPTAMTLSPNRGRSWGRVDGIDLLRALSIVFVIMNHVSIRLLLAQVPYTEHLPDPLVRFLIWNGQNGVQIFFAISGFLITSTALRRWGSLDRVGIPDFYKLRLARIGPMLLTLLALFSILHFAGVTIFVVHVKQGGLGRALLAALTFHINVLEARRGYLPPAWDILWSLSVEEMFYLFFPLFSRWLGRIQLFAPVLLVFVALGPLARTIWTHGNATWQEYSYLGGMDAIALGCLTALLMAKHRFSRRSLTALGVIGGAAMILILCFSRRAMAWGISIPGLSMSILAIGTCTVIMVAAQTQWRAPRVLSPLLALGQRSYEVYLTHAFIVLGFFHLFLAAGKPMRGVAVLFISTALVASLLGELVGRFYSEPMNRWLRKRWGDGPEKLGSVIEPLRIPEMADGETVA